jgi:peptidoglycan/xylan/chitin deacetylase (PgdA/CDA1 family)
VSIVLCYHAVSDTWPERFSVSTDQLRAHVEHLLARGYTATTFSDTVVATRRKTFAVTFDDAFQSVHERAFPLLSALGVPATVFASSALVESGEPLGIGYERWLDTEHAGELAIASWEQLQALVEAGWEIGSHACSHPFLTQLDDATLDRELSASRAALEARLGRPCRSLAYPYADVDSRVVAATRAAGYDCAATVYASFDAPDDPLRQPRVVIYREDTFARFKLKTRPAFYKLVISGPVRTIRQAARRGGSS